MGSRKQILEINPDTNEIMIKHESMGDASLSLGLKKSSTCGIFNACRDGNIYYGSKWKYYEITDGKVKKTNDSKRKPMLKLDKSTGKIIECFKSSRESAAISLSLDQNVPTAHHRTSCHVVGEKIHTRMDSNGHVSIIKAFKTGKIYHGFIWKYKSTEYVRS